VIDHTAPTYDQVLQFLKFVTDANNLPADVHCHAGQGRTGTFVATYRIAVQGWTPDDAIAEAQKFKAGSSQIAFLQDFATHLGDPEIQAFLGAPGSK
jgi:protein tyrosine/serine phosphatase